jgi:type IV fimbrial biogenesis protein FimT
MKKPTHTSSGFTLLELLATLSIVGILSLLAFPNLRGVRDQMRVSQDARSVAALLTELRAEAIRLKQPVRISFTASGVQWDYAADGMIDGSYALQPGSTWQQLPTDLTFNGFGLLRGVTTDRAMTLHNGSIKLTITVNTNGHLEL